MGSARSASLRVGDLVIGSDGRPTPVLGVYPQGRREVFRVRAQDGASTMCCGEHLWAVATRDDRRRGKPLRVLETREMLGRSGRRTTTASSCRWSPIRSSSSLSPSRWTPTPSASCSATAA